MLSFNHAQIEALVRNQTTVEQLQFGSLKLGTYFDNIDYFEINYISVISPDSRKLDYEQSDFTIRERLDQLYFFDGWIGVAGGLGCGIQNQIIDKFRISSGYLAGNNSFTREDIIRFHGKPDCELVNEIDWGSWHIDIDQYILVYKPASLNFFLDARTGRLTEIHVGELDKSNYTVR